MLKPDDFYNQVGNPLDEKLLNKLVNKYLSILYDDINNNFQDLNNLRRCFFEIFDFFLDFV